MSKGLFLEYFYQKNKTRYIEKKVFLYLLCDDYVSSIADGTSVSTFLGTRKLGLEEVSVNLIDELTQVHFQGSK